MSRFIGIFFIVALFDSRLNASDSIPILLLDKRIQFEVTDAIHDMYNFEFDRAQRQYKMLKEKYPWHPLPYFLMGLNLWWQIIPNLENEEYDEEFLAYMDTSEYLSQQLFEEVSEIEGAFFLAATYAFQGRLYSERKQWRKAAFAGKNALKYLDYTRGHEDFSPEILFGDALFNYYREWVPENYPILKFIMFMFPNGNKDLGIQQLKEVARNAFYTRTEAQYFLMRILASEGNDLTSALQVSRYLAETFPYNAYFHRYYARLLYQMGRYHLAKKESMEILKRIDEGQPGYESNSGRYATFFLAHINKTQGQDLMAKDYYLRCLEFGEKINAQDRGYYIYSLYHLGKIYQNLEEFEEAEEYYKRVKKLTKRKHPANKQSRDDLKGLKKARKEKR